MLADVDLGVVPHLWEDCYPQVTVEFVCNGVPVIVSNLGGAKEVSSQPDFEFDVGTTPDSSASSRNSQTTNKSYRISGASSP